jgi:prepilin-type N-terminal cleavage/methylation domain-containing protein
VKRQNTALKKHGFSLLEIIACVAIIAIVAAILTPVFRATKHSAQITSSLSNLHQIYIALAMYQGANGGGGNYSSLAGMGLPEPEQLFSSTKALPLNLPLDVWRSPCGQNPAWTSVLTSVQYVYFPGQDLDNYEKIAPLYQDNMAAFIDMNCAEHGEPLYSDYIPHRGLGVLLSGALVNRIKPGDSRYQKWWSDPVTNKE